MKPLFIPLKTQFYEDFDNRIKKHEMRLYGPRWNEKTCFIGRKVVLSKGYGKKHRLEGWVKGFYKVDPKGYEASVKQSVIDCYGTLDKEIAHIEIELGKPPETLCKDTIFMFPE